MKETTRTMIFAAAAVASVALAAAAHFVSKPSALSEYGRAGTEFYPEFTNPNDANAIKVVAWDEATATPRDFEVRFDHGRWLIPSHHNYPADAKDRLAKTAASIIGVKRGGLASRYEDDHERYGVIDPDNRELTTLKGRGQRLTLTKNDEVLADFIIGKPVEGEENVYYVRNPREKETYRVALTIDLSTKFADWIEPDLLQVDRGDLREIVTKKYSVNQEGQIVDRAETRLTHDKSSSDWKLDGLKTETEDVNADEVRKMVGSLDDLRIVGVRPKPGGLSADLTLDRNVAKDPLAFTTLDNDLRRRGFVLYQDDNKDLKLASKEGAISAKSSQGIEYALHFGDIFTGDEKEIEIGGASGSDTEAAEKKDGDKGDAGKKEGDEAKAGENKDGEKKDDAKEPADAALKDGAKPEDAKDVKDKQKRSRYLFVSVAFDPKLVGETPVKPTEPQKPAEPAADADKNKPADPDKDKPADAAEGKPADGDAEKAKPAEPSTPPADEPPPGGDAESKSDGEEDGSIDADESTDADETAEADESAEQGAEPVEPVKPEEPVEAGKKSEEAAEPAEKDNPETKSDADKDQADKINGEQKEQTDEKEKPEEKPKDPKVEYEMALAKYKTDLQKYEDDLKQHEKKIEDGRKKFEQLKARFGGWYYVISAESFETLRLTHDLVKPKEKKDDKAIPGLQPDPSLEIPPNLQPKPGATETPADGDKPAADDKPADAAQPETTEPPAETKDPDAAKAPETPARGTPPAETPPAETPPAEKKEAPPATPK